MYWGHGRSTKQINCCPLLYSSCLYLQTCFDISRLQGLIFQTFPMHALYIISVTRYTSGQKALLYSPTIGSSCDWPKFRNPCASSCCRMLYSAMCVVRTVRVWPVVVVIGVNLPCDKLTWDRASLMRLFKDDSKFWTVSSWACTRFRNFGESSKQPFKSKAGMLNVGLHTHTHTQLAPPPGPLDSSIKEARISAMQTLVILCCLSMQLNRQNRSLMHRLLEYLNESFDKLLASFWQAFGKIKWCGICIYMLILKRLTCLQTIVIVGIHRSNCIWFPLVIQGSSYTAIAVENTTCFLPFLFPIR